MMAKNIVICMDGTWNDPTERTNVYNLFRALDAGEPVDGNAASGPYLRREADGMLAFYIEGVGAKGRSQGFLGGTLGVGLHARVLHAFLLGSQAYAKGDKFWIFGFSRGAWSARSLAGLISNAGLLPPMEATGQEGIEKAEAIWLETKTKGTLDRAQAFWNANDPVPIQLVGVWDTVGALGIPFFNGIKAFDRAEKALFDFADLKLSPRVKHARHAISIDEQRKDFEPTLWEPRQDSSIRQVWFSGVHADVGGGYPETGLSDIALEWMVAEAAALDAKLGLDLKRVNPDPRPDPKQDRHDEASKKLWQLRPVEPRRVPADASLHSSVIERLQVRTDYRPAALRRHPEVAPLFADPLPKEDIFQPDEWLPASHLKENEEVEDDVFAQNCWNAVQLEVKKGERYEIVASGKWKDKDYEAPASGYESPNDLMKRLEGTRRVKDKPWFCLIACVHKDPTLESRNPDAGNMVTGILQSLTHSVGTHDAESQLVGVGQEGHIEPDRDGYLYLFANDSAWAYSNNSGYLTVKVRRSR